MGKGDFPRSCFSKEFRDNYDCIFLKLTGSEWCQKHNIIVYSLGEWDSKDFETQKMNWDDFFCKICFCTVAMPRELIEKIRRDEDIQY